MNTYNDFDQLGLWICDLGANSVLRNIKLLLRKIIIYPLVIPEHMWTMNKQKKVVVRSGALLFGKKMSHIDQLTQNRIGVYDIRHL